MIVNPKGEMKGSAITGPVAKECVRPHVSFHCDCSVTLCYPGGSVAPYRFQRWNGGLIAFIHVFVSLYFCGTRYGNFQEKHLPPNLEVNAVDVISRTINNFIPPNVVHV